MTSRPGASEEARRALSRPDFYPHAPSGVEVHETHISWVFLAGERAYKLKKPLVLPFLDYGTPERRRAMCHDEVRLNRRLAPDVYLGVRSVARRDGRLALAGDEDPDAVEHVVEMARFDEDDTLAAHVAAGTLDAREIGAVADRLAAFHAEAAPVRHAGAELLGSKRVADGNFDVLLGHPEVIEPERVTAAARFALSFLVGHREAVAARDREGHVVDGHGDLRAEHVLLRGTRVEVVDCVEFDAELRAVDAGADLAFLVMDLERLGAPGAGRDLVAAYRRAGGDPGPPSHIAFHAALRAWVRAKIACLRAGDPTADAAERAAARERARALFALGERLAWRARLPLVLVVCGVPASGKSHLASELSKASGLAVVGSDALRKRLAGIQATERAPQSAYGPEVTRRTYRELGLAAARESAASGGVIVDATLRRTADRAVFRDALGAAEGAVVHVECLAPPGVLAARARGRAGDPAAVSDAGPAEVERLRHEWEPLADVSPECHLVVRTDRDVAEVAGDVVALLDRRTVVTSPRRG